MKRNLAESPKSRLAAFLLFAGAIVVTPPVVGGCIEADTVEDEELDLEEDFVTPEEESSIGWSPDQIRTMIRRCDEIYDDGDPEEDKCFRRAALMCEYSMPSAACRVIFEEEGVPYPLG